MPGATESIVMTYFAQTVGETEFLDDAIKKRRLDLSDEKGLEFAGRLIIGQVQALQYIARQIDELQAAVRGY